MFSAERQCSGFDDERLLLQSIRKLHEETERISEYNFALDNAYVVSQRQHRLILAAQWDQKVTSELGRHYATHIAAFAVSLFSLWRQEAARVQTLTRFAHSDIYVVFFTVHLFWAWRHVTQQSVWLKELQTAAGKSKKLQTQCEEQVAAYQAQMLAAQHREGMNRLKKWLRRSDADTTKKSWRAWVHFMAEIKYAQTRAKSIVESLKMMLRTSESQVAEQKQRLTLLSFCCFHENAVEARQRKLQTSHGEHIGNMAQNEFMKRMDKKAAGLMKFVFRTWLADARAAGIQRDFDRKHENLQKSANDALHRERQSKNKYAQTCAEKVIASIFAGDSPEVMLDSYFNEWRHEAAKAADCKKQEKLRKQVSSVSEGIRKRDGAGDIEAKKMAAMLAGCFVNMCFQGWVCYNNDIHRARRVQLETHQLTITKEINAARQRAWQIEASEALEVLCEWMSKQIGAQQRDTLQHWHSKRWVNHRVVAAAIVGTRDPSRLAERMVEGEYAQAADQELQIMQRRLAEPIALRKNLEDRVANMYDASVQKLRCNRRVVCRVVNDDECDQQDVKEALMKWKANLAVCQAWRLKGDWEDRAKAREEEKRQLLEEQEEALRQAHLIRMTSRRQNALLVEITDVWRAAAAADRAFREKLEAMKKAECARQSMILLMEGELKDTINSRHLKLEGMFIRWTKADETDKIKEALQAWVALTDITRLKGKFGAHKANLSHLVTVQQADVLLLRGCLSTWKILYCYSRALAEIKVLEAEHMDQVLVEQRHAGAELHLTNLVQRYEALTFCCFFVHSWRSLLEERVMNTTTDDMHAHWLREEQRNLVRSHSIANRCYSLQELTNRKATKEKGRLVQRKVFTAWFHWCHLSKLVRDFERRKEAAHYSLHSQSRFEHIATKHLTDKCLEFEYDGVCRALTRRCLLAWELLTARRRAHHKEQLESSISSRLVYRASKVLNFDSAQSQIFIIGWRRLVIDSKKRFLTSKRRKLEAALVSKFGSSSFFVARSVDTSRLRSNIPMDSKYKSAMSSTSTPLVNTDSTTLVNTQTILSGSTSLVNTQTILSGPGSTTDNDPPALTDFASRLNQLSFIYDVEKETKESQSQTEIPTLLPVPTRASSPETPPVPIRTGQLLSESSISLFKVLSESSGSTPLQRSRDLSPFFQSPVVRRVPLSNLSASGDVAAQQSKILAPSRSVSVGGFGAPPTLLKTPVAGPQAPRYTAG